MRSLVLGAVVADLSMGLHGQPKSLLPECVVGKMERLFQNNVKAYKALKRNPIGRKGFVRRFIKWLWSERAPDITWTEIDSPEVKKLWDTTSERFDHILAKVYARDVSGGWLLNRRKTTTDEECPLAEIDSRFELTLERRIASTGPSTIFTAIAVGENIPRDVVIKYTNNCAKMGASAQSKGDELLIEYLVMRILADFKVDIAPKVFALSSVVVPDLSDWETDERTRSKIVDNPKGKVVPARECLSRGSSIRAIVEEKFDSDLLEYVYQRVDRIERAIECSMRTIEMLRKLHDVGFIHGDVHSRNVAVRSDEVLLIDFGFAQFFPTAIGTKSERVPIPHDLTRLFLSHWHLGGSRIGRRDEVYRAVEMTADLLHPAFHGYLQSLRNNSEMMRKFKAKCPYFTERYENLTICDRHSLEGEDLKRCNTAMTHLNEALASVRKIPHADARPNYDEVISHYETALNALHAP
jgi:hypothetical protein